MSEWKIIESDQFSDLPLEDGQQSSLLWRWSTLVGGVLAFLSVVGLLTLQVQRTEGRMAAKDDLTAFIFEENVLQFLGREEQAVNLMLPSAPQEWQEKYRQLFRDDRDQPPEGSFQLTKVDIDDECVTVELERERSKWVAAYCLVDQKWRRAPVQPNAWGDTHNMIEIVDGLELHFLPRDQAFAEALAADLRHFLRNLQQWGYYSNAILTATAESNQPFEIIIEPRDLHPALVVQQKQRLVVNSPSLVPADELLNGEEAVRLAVARALLRLTEPNVEMSKVTLPGAAVYMEATRTVVAAHSMLPVDVLRSLMTSWRSQLDGRWVPPLYAELMLPDQTLAARRAELAARLMLDHIYITHGPRTLKLLSNQVPQTRSWDRLFQSILGQSMIELETEAAVYAHADWSSKLTLGSNVDIFPLRAKLIRIGYLKNEGKRAYVTAFDQLDPIVVDIPLEVHFVTMNRQVIPAGCLRPDTRVLIEGEWLEVQRRLQATQITLEEFIPTDERRCSVSMLTGGWVR